MGKLRRCEGGRLSFWCPGCEERHTIRIATAETPGGWTWNGDEENPTFNPSVLVRGGHYLKGGAPGNCYCDFKARTGKDPSFTCCQCHTYVTAGQIHFLPDCSHALAGQTVPLPDFPDGEDAA